MPEVKHKSAEQLIDDEYALQLAASLRHAVILARRAGVMKQGLKDAINIIIDTAWALP